MKKKVNRQKRIAFVLTVPEPYYPYAPYPVEALDSLLEIQQTYSPEK